MRAPGGFRWRTHAKLWAFCVGGWLGVAVLTLLGIPFVWSLVVWIWVLTIAFMVAVLLLVKRW